MSFIPGRIWEPPAAICDGCGERLFPYDDLVVLAYVLDERAEPVRDNPRHYHLHCAATQHIQDQP